MSFVWWNLWRSFEVYHRWSGWAFGDLLILPPKFCPLHPTCINQRFTTAYVLAAHSGRQKDKFVEINQSLLCCWSLPSSWQSTLTLIILTTVWTCKLSQLLLLTFGNTSPSPPLWKQIHLHVWIILKLSLCTLGTTVCLLFLVTLGLALHEHRIVLHTMKPQEVYKSVYAATYVPFMASCSFL